jgi:hypothetical protein
MGKRFDRFPLALTVSEVEAKPNRPAPAQMKIVRV